MLFGKGKKKIDEERQLHYGDGKLEKKNSEVIQDIRAYTMAARWFEKRVAEDYRKKARNSRRLSIFFGILAFASVIAVMGLTPLKTVETTIIRVDRNSGYMDVIRPGWKKEDTKEVADDKHYISMYILARERYNWASQKANFAIVQQLSYPDVFNEYKNFQLSSKGYVATLGSSRQVDVSIDSIVPLPVSHEKKLGERDDIKTYQVRFSQSLLDAEGKPVSDIGRQLKLDADGKPIAEPKRVYWTAIISFDYRNAPLTEGAGWVNPKGFGVLAYSKTQEIREGR
ncbi:type IV secretion system protein [Salmonella enterica]|nr:type IV secretion system protein [Salmonella enterica]